MNEKKENVIVNGFFWRFAERCGVQLISAVVSILLARILTPDDYGKVALVTVFNNIMYVLLDCGIGTALVQKKEYLYRVLYLKLSEPALHLCMRKLL